MNLKFFVVLAFVLLAQLSYGQNKCECPNKEVLTTSFSSFLDNSDLKGANVFWSKMSEESTPACKLHVALLVANVAYNVHDSVAMRTTLNRASLLADSTCDEFAYGNLMWRWSQYYRLVEKYDSAIYWGQRSLIFCEKTGNNAITRANLTTLAQIMMGIGEPQRAVEYQRKCADLCEKVKSDKTGIVFGNLGAVYGALFDATGDSIYLDSVVYALNKSNEHVQTQQVNLEQISYNYSNIASVYVLRQKYQLALLYCDSALNAPLQSPVARASTYTAKYNICASMGDYPNALRFADSSYAIAMRSEDTRTVVTTMQSVYEAHKLNGNTAQALDIFERLVHIRDSINNSERIAAITAVEEQFNKTKNEKKISELNQQQEISSLNIKLLTAGIIGAILVILLVVIFFRQSLLKKNQIQLETEQRLNRARMNPHFFFNTLSSLQTSALKDKDPAKLADLLSMYAKIMRNTLESTYEDLISIENEVDYLEMYLKLQQFRNNGTFSYSVVVDEKIDPSEVLIPGMIIQPIVENAIEHGLVSLDRLGKIEVSFKIENDMLKITVSDNGTGLSTSQVQKTHKSRATEITRDRLFLINRKFNSKASQTISANANNQGTTVEVILPLNY